MLSGGMQMKIRISELPEGNVSVVKTGGWNYVTMYKNAKQIDDENGQKIYEANVLTFSIKEITKEQVIAQFDWYWNKYISVEVNKKKAEKIVMLQQLLAKTDYEAIKYSEGVISQQQYATLAQARAAWRTAINALEQCTTIEQIEAVEFSTSIPKIGA